NIIFAPTCSITLALAVYVYADVMTSSPGPTPSRRKVISMQAVAEFIVTDLSVLQNSAIFFSNCFVLGPVVIHPERNASVTLSISFSVISGGENGIFILTILYTPYIYILS